MPIISNKPVTGIDTANANALFSKLGDAMLTRMGTRTVVAEQLSDEMTAFNRRLIERKRNGKPMTTSSL